MLRKIRRQFERLSGQAKARTSGLRPQKASLHSLQLENLEKRVLLDVSGIWDELGWRSASGGGVSYDQESDAAESSLVLTSDGDPVVLWVESPVTEWVETPQLYGFQGDGGIHARQFVDDNLGWWDLTPGSGDITTIGSGGQLDVEAGPSGQIVVVWNDLSGPLESSGEIHAALWDGDGWQSLMPGADIISNAADGITHENPNVAYSPSGEIFFTYTAIHPDSGQREIIVQKFGYTYEDSIEIGPPTPADLGIVELVNEDVNTLADFLEPNAVSIATFGMSNDEANSYDPAITVDMEGRPIVTWVNHAYQNNSEIFVRRWDGESWEQIGIESADDTDGDGNAGVSNDGANMSLQPDVVMAPNGDVFVSWVEWQNWKQYENNGQAGLYIKVLRSNSSVWEEYAPGSASGAGLADADDNDLISGAGGLGWYYDPEIIVNQDSEPVVYWQGFGSGERYSWSRTPPLNTDEYPYMSVYLSQYEDGQFQLLYNEEETLRGTINELYYAWTPTAIYRDDPDNPGKELLLTAYIEHDSFTDLGHFDNEVFVKFWDGDSWEEYGKGAGVNGSTGNLGVDPDDTDEMKYDMPGIGAYPFSEAYAEYLLGDVEKNIDLQMGLFDHDNNPATEPYIMAVVPTIDSAVINDAHVYLFNRDTGKWSDDIDTLPNGIGRVFELKGDPTIEYQLSSGAPLLAYLDDVTGLPYVYEYVGGDWNLIGNGPASDEPGEIVREAITVQAGPDGQVLLAYTNDNGSSTDIVTYLWDPEEGSWQEAGGGQLDKQSELEITYFSEYTGADWDRDGTLEDGEIDADRQRQYALAAWAGWDVTAETDGYDVIYNDDQSHDLVEWSIAEGAGFIWVDEDDEPTEEDPGQDQAPEMVFTIPVDEFDVADFSTENLVGEFDYRLPMMGNGYVVVELMYELDTTQVPNADLSMYLDFWNSPDARNSALGAGRGGNDVAPTNSILIDSIPAGSLKSYSEQSTHNADLQVKRTLTLDTKELGFNLMQSGLTNIMSIRFEADVNESEDLLFSFDSGDGEVPEGSEGWSFTDATGGGNVTGNFKNYADVDDGYYQDGFNQGSNDNPTSGGLEMVALGGTNGTNITGEGYFERDFFLGGPLELTLDYQLLQDPNGAALAANSEILLMLSLYDKETDTSTFITSANIGADNNLGFTVTDDEVDSGWQNITITLDEEFGLEPGRHTLRLEPRLFGDGAAPTGDALVLVDNLNITPTGDRAYQAIGRVDNVSIYQRIAPGTTSVMPDDDNDGNPDPIIENSAFDQDIQAGPGEDDNFDSTHPMTWNATFGRTALDDDGTVIPDQVDGGMQFALGDGTTVESDITRAFTYDFNLPAGVNQAYMDLNFDALMVMGQDIGHSETLTLSVRVDETDGGTTVLDLGSVDLVSDNGTTVTSGWLNWNGLAKNDPADYLLPSLNAGNYQVVVTAELSQSAVGLDADGNPEEEQGQAFVYFDNLELDLVQGYSQWEFMPREGNATTTGPEAVGGNNKVGFINEDTGIATFDDQTGNGFQADMHAHVSGDVQSFLIEDVVHGDLGEIEVGMRLRADDGLAGFVQDTVSIQVSRNGGEFVPLEYHDFVQDDFEDLFAFTKFTSGTWFFDGSLLGVPSEYSFVKASGEDLEPGTYTIKIELDVSQFGGEHDLWVDNVYVLSAFSGGTNQQRPIATLTPTGGDTRSFVVGVTNQSNIQVYPTSGEFEPWERGAILNFTPLDFMEDGYYSSSIFVLEDTVQQDGTVVPAWDDYIDKLQAMNTLDLFGGLADEHPVASEVLVSLASAELNGLSGLTFGPGSLPWIVTQWADTEFVDTDDDGVNDRFDVHAFNVLQPPDFWNLGTTNYDINVWRWSNVQDGGLGGDPNYQPQWVDAGLVPRVTAHANTYPRITSTGDQEPIVYWTTEDIDDFIIDIHAQKYEGDGLWGIFGMGEVIDGTEIDIAGNVVGPQSWGSNLSMDLITLPDGDPLVSFWAGHVDSLAVREFRKTVELPTIVYQELTGISDNVLEFESEIIVRFDDLTGEEFKEANKVDRVLSISNAGLGDLLIYDIDFGGQGDLEYNPFSFVNQPDDFPGIPIEVEATDDVVDRFDIVVRFDPIDPSTGEPIAPGVYEGAMLVYHNAPNSTHPFGHFQEIILRAEVTSAGILTIDEEDLLLGFDRRIINDGGLSGLEGNFEQDFYLPARDDVELDFDYQLMLSDGLEAVLDAEDVTTTDPLTLSLVVSVDGVDITPDDPNQFIIDRDNYQTLMDTYLSATLDLGRLSRGNHTLTIRAELSESVDGEFATVQLDNIQLTNVADFNYTFHLQPAKNEWVFTPDERDEDFTTGEWTTEAGKTGGGLEMILGQPEEIETVEISNTGKESFTVTEWFMDGVAFEITEALFTDINPTTMEVTETILDTTTNNVGAADDIVIGAGDSLTLSIVFQPDEAIFFDETLLIRSDLPGDELTAVRLVGSGRSGADIDVTYNGEVIQDFDQETGEFDQIDFGSVRQGTRKDLSFTITNVGSTDLTIENVLEDNINNDFILIRPIIEDLVLEPDQSQEIILSYEPDRPISGEIAQIENMVTYVLINNDSPYLEDRAYLFEVVGTGVPSTFTDLELVNPESGDPFLNQRIDFGKFYVGQTVEKSFQIKNVGGTDLQLERFIIVGNDSFSQDVIALNPENEANNPADDITIEFGDDPETVTVTFSPTTAGTLNREIRIFYIDEDGNTRTSEDGMLRLAGSVTSQQLRVVDSQGDDGDKLIDFGTLPISQDAQTQTITVSNVGDAGNITIDGWTFTGDDAFSVQAFEGDDIILNPGESIEIEVGFTPENDADYTGSIVISSSDPVTPEWQIDLAGQGGTPGDIAVDKTELNFGTVIPGSQAQESFTITNTGESRMRLTGLEIPSSFFLLSQMFDADDDQEYIELDPGEQFTVMVTFKPIGLFDSQTSTIPMEVRITADDLTGGELDRTTVALNGQSVIFTEITNGRYNWLDDDNNIVQIVVSGGTARVIPFSNTNNDIGQIELVSASSRTSVTIIGPRAGETTVGRISGTAARNIILKNVRLDGDMDNDGVQDNDYALEFGRLSGVLMVGNVVDDADVYIGDTSNGGVVIQTGAIEDGSRFIVNGDVRSFVAESFGAPDPTENAYNFEAESLKKLFIRDGAYNARTFIENDINAVVFNHHVSSGDLIAGGDINKVVGARTTFSGAIRGDNLNVLVFDGLHNASISVPDGTIRKLIVQRDILDTVISGGYDLGMDGRLGGGDDELHSGAQIDMVVAGGEFAGTYLMAGIAANEAGTFDVFGTQSPMDVRSGKIGKVLLGDIDADNDGEDFGIAAHTSIGQVRAGRSILEEGTDLDFNLTLL